jgi:hypothetical protein
MMATSSATPNIRWEIENVALSCAFFIRRWGDNGRFATRANRGTTSVQGCLPDGGTFGRRAPRGEDL